MARVCDVCGKGSLIITPRKLLRAHRNPTTKQRRYPNLQPRRIAGMKIKLCTRCLKTAKRDTAKEIA
ncbi:MAG: 50S ribosomal protein L28 [Parcubacteria group bacterium]|nr:50S ribosomal protein L28 [Parcubacteria group bacterium]